MPQNNHGHQDDIHLIGHSNWSSPHPLTLVFGVLGDLGLGLGIFATGVLLNWWQPFPAFSNFAPSLVIWAAIESIFWFFFKASIGLRLAGIRSIRSKGNVSLQSSLNRPIHQWGRALAVSLPMLIGSLYWNQFELGRSPYWMPVQYQEVPTFAPSSTNEWVTLPFFYTLGAWPKQFSGRPIYFVLPYKKGPPHKFIPNIFARWFMPEISLTIEGPKTPKPTSPPKELAQCFLPDSASSKPKNCAKLRYAALQRHVDEIRADLSKKHSINWEIQWFEVQNPSLPQSERPQGIKIIGSQRLRSHTRYVLINPDGRHQAFILRTHSGNLGDRAKELLAKSIGSIRVTNELGSGKAIVNRQIASIQFGSLHQAQDTQEFLSQLASIQAILVSKVTINPNRPEPYYHLGKMALLTAQRANAARSKQTQVLSTDQMILLDEASAAAKPTLQSSFMYAKDIAPRDQRTQELENLWIQAQNY